MGPAKETGGCRTVPPCAEPDDHRSYPDANCRIAVLRFVAPVWLGGGLLPPEYGLLLQVRRAGPRGPVRGGLPALQGERAALDTQMAAMERLVRLDRIPTERSCSSLCWTYDRRELPQIGDSEFRDRLDYARCRPRLGRFTRIHTLCNVGWPARCRGRGSQRHAATPAYRDSRFILRNRTVQSRTKPLLTLHQKAGRSSQVAVKVGRKRRSRPQTNPPRRVRRQGALPRFTSLNRPSLPDARAPSILRDSTERDRCARGVVDASRDGRVLWAGTYFASKFLVGGPSIRRRLTDPAQTPRNLWACHYAQIGLRYAGLRAWIKYIGVKMPSRPASVKAAAHRFKVSDTRTVPRGAM